MNPALGTAALGLAGLCLGLAAGALPAAAAADAPLALSTAQLGLLVSVGLWTRALTAAFAGALVDRFGGRRSLRDASAGALVAALALGVVFLTRREQSLFVAVAILQAAICYFLAFAAPAAARVNAARLEPALRGRHAGLYGALAFPAELLALPAGLWLAARVPAAALALAPALAAALGLAAAWRAPNLARREGPRPGVAELRALALRPDMLGYAAVAAFTGAARFGLLGWSAQFLSEVHQVRVGGPLFGWAVVSAASGAFAGPLAAGWLSDRTFAGRRAPAATSAFALLAVALAAFGRTTDPVSAVACLGLACAGVFGAHAVIIGAAAMDVGGRRSAGAACGLLNGVHHAAGALSLLLVGELVNRGGWSSWTAALLPLSLAGAAAAYLTGLLKPAAPDRLL